MRTRARRGTCYCEGDGLTPTWVKQLLSRGLGLDAEVGPYAQYLHIYIYIHTYTYMYMYMHMYMYMYIYIYVCTHVYLYCVGVSKIRVPNMDLIRVGPLL